MRNSRVNCVPLCSADFGRICLNTVFIQCIGHFLCMGRVAILGFLDGLCRRRKARLQALPQRRKRRRRRPVTLWCLVFGVNEGSTAHTKAANSRWMTERKDHSWNMGVQAFNRRSQADVPLGFLFVLTIALTEERENYKRRGEWTSSTQNFHRDSQKM